MDWQKLLNCKIEVQQFQAILLEKVKLSANYIKSEYRIHELVRVPSIEIGMVLEKLVGMVLQLRMENVGGHLIVYESMYAVYFSRLNENFEFKILFSRENIADTS